MGKHAEPLDTLRTMSETSAHPSFIDEPAAEDVLWRYMDLPRFLSLLEYEALHFASANQMSDRWEGSYSPLNIEHRATLYGEFWEEHGDPMKGVREWSRQRMYMNCWHESVEESAAMWELYQREGRGVAVRTTWGDLTASVGSNAAVRGGRVTYADYKSTQIPEGNVHLPFMFKRNSFSHEKEVRLLVFDADGGSPVITVPVEIKRLINAVYIAPDAPGWFGTLIRNVVHRYGHDIDVRQSDLNSDPID